jgi:hypothetical protein
MVNKNSSKGRLLLILGLLVFCSNLVAQSVAISNSGAYTAESSAMLDVSSTEKGILAPRMTAAQKAAISSPATGLLIYQTDETAGFYYYDGSSWSAFGSSSLALDDLTNCKTSENSVYVGDESGDGDTGDNYSCAIGYRTLNSDNSGVYNTAVGCKALSSTVGSNNVSIGNHAGWGPVGSYNTIIGSEAAYSGCSTGNVFIGHRSGSSSSGDNKLFIENTYSETPLIYGEFDNNNLTFNANDGETEGVVTINDVMKLTPRSSAPSSPTEGVIYVNSSDHHIYCYLNASWVQLD